MLEKRIKKITDAWICQVQNEKVVPVFGDLILENDKIFRIEQKDFDQYLRSKREKSDAEYSADGRVITLPLINFHDHFYSRLAKGLPVSGKMDNFVGILENLWWKLDLLLDEEMIRASAQMAILESLQQGVTTIFDHHSSPLVAEQSLEIIGEEMEKFGLRGVLCFETTDRNGKELAQQGLQANIDFLSRENSDLKGVLGLHASFTLTDETMGKVSEIAEKFNCGVHIHLCEDSADVEISKEKFGAAPAQRLKKFNLLNEKTLLAHGVHLTDADYEIIEKSGSALIYNPDSNLNNSVGLPRYAAAPQNIPILPGTDGMHANIARTLKQLFLLYRSRSENPDDAFGWLQKIYFDQLAFVRRYFPDFPNLQQSDRADFIVWDYVPPTPLTRENFWGHFIYGVLERPVVDVVHGGNIISPHSVSNDYTELRKEIHKQGRRLFEKFK
ncbi:hypothetical protein B6D60_07185 [candidate division KSB1 bacterium 4484_87]|nr:MAG: hypothetical protein B6D60_07185 [candidate division KSB1 bacterium 4484_87]